jgi:hypothetical protein
MFCREMAWWAKRASKTLRTSKKTLGIALDSRMDLRIGGDELVSGGVNNAVSKTGAVGVVELAGVENADAPRLWVSMMYVMFLERTWRVSREIVPLRLSFAPSGSMYKLGGEVGRSLRVASSEASSAVVAMKVTDAMILTPDVKFVPRG